MNAQPSLATLDYLIEVAKDWVESAFASALDGEFALDAHRFELDGSTVQRRKLASHSHEATDPLGADGDAAVPMAWAHGATLVMVVDSPSGPVAYDQEIVEILAVQDDDVVSVAACVVRIPGLPPCLGRFW